MRVLITIILLLGCLNSKAQVEVLKEFDFSEGGYSLYLVDVTGPQYTWERDSLKRLLQIDTTRHYYTEDSLILNQLKKDLIGERVDYQYECWYNYFIYLTYHDSTVLQMRVNLSCEELILEGRAYQIEPSVITDLIPKCNALKKRVFNCEYFQECREFWKELENDKQYVLQDISKPKWVDYNGEFRISYIDTIQNRLTGIESYLNGSISKAHPNEEFNISWASISGDDHSFYLTCDKSLYDGFNLYDKGEWKAFKYPMVTMYWKPE